MIIAFMTENTGSASPVKIENRNLLSNPTLLLVFFAVVMASGSSKSLVGVSVVPVVPRVTEKLVEATFIYYGSRILCTSASLSGLLQCPTGSFSNELDTDIENVENSLNINDQGQRNFILIQKDPPVYVYTYQPEEQLSASSVSIGAWDKFAKIGLVPTDVPEMVCDVDFLPFFYDNEELLKSCPTDNLLKDVVYRGALECKKYSYATGQVGILWDEKVWCRRLYHCLSEKEEDLGIRFVNLMKEGQDWMTAIPTVLHAPHFSWRITPFKGVTDIQALGRNTLSIMVSDMEAEVEAASFPGTLYLEIRVEKPKLIDCLLLLPRKLGELLSSMYLIGVIRSAHCDCTITVYGWLIFRSTFSIGVELHISDKLCTVNILWRTSNYEANQFQYFFKQIG